MNSPDTRAARSTILRTLRGSVPAQPLPVPNLQPYLEGPYGRGCLGDRPDPATLIESFETAARGWRADVLHAGPHDWPQAVRGALDQRACTRVALGAGGPLSTELMPALQGLTLRPFAHALAGAWKAELFDAIDAGITSVVAGVADTGTLLLRPGPDEPRTLSLVPPVHVAVLRASTLYAGLPAAMRALSPQSDMPTNLLLITGPSKTADIQQTLAYGAHGPKALVIVLVHDLPAEAGAHP